MGITRNAIVFRIKMADILEKKIQDGLNDIEYIKVIDETGGGCEGGKFSCIIVSSKFDGVALLERHRMINEILSEEMKTIHALSLKTWTPKQWEKKKADYI